MNPAVQLFQEHTRLFFSARSPTDLKQANDYFMALKQDRIGLEIAMQVVLTCGESTALILACNILLDFLSERWNIFRPEERRSLYESLCAGLTTRGGELLIESQLAVEKLCETLGRLTRQFWSEDTEAKRVIQFAITLVAKQGRELVGCLVLRKVIEEMTPTVTRPRPQHQRHSQLFKSDHLPTIFQIGSDLLIRSIPLNDSSLSLGALKLLVSVLSFDTSEETGVWKAVLVSSDTKKTGCWRLLEEVETPNLIYKMYCYCHEQGSGKEAPICFLFLSLVVSVQRYFYQNMSLREDILKAIVQGLMVIMEKNVGLGDSDSLLALCKLCEALASCSVHTDIKDRELVQRFLADVFTLTVNLLASPINDNAVFFLLQFWSRLVPSLRLDPNNPLKPAVLKLLEEYLTACSICIQQDNDRELMDDATIAVVSEIVRTDTVGIGHRCLTELRTVAGMCISGTGNLHQLQFLIKLTSSVMNENRKISSKKIEPKRPTDKLPATVLSFEETELYGHLSAELFKICILAKDNPTNRPLLLACVGFLRSFQCLFLSENSNPQLQMTYAFLISSLRLSDENGIVELWIELTLQYLTCACCEPLDQELITQSVGAFYELIAGSKRFRDFTSQTEFILVGALHLKPQFISTLLNSLVTKRIFLPYDSSLFSARAKLFASAAKLLFWTHRTLEGARVEDWLRVHFACHSSPNLYSYLAWIYEQKGMVQAITLSGDYLTWSEWFLEGPSEHLLSQLHSAPSSIPLLYGALKLTCECSNNRINRILFPQHSLLGNDLTRFLISVLHVYFTHTFTLQVGNQYEERYKPFCRAVATVTNLISGRYCNVSNFITSTDPSFRVMFEAALQCMRKIPVEDLLAYQRQFQCVWDMVEISTQFEGLLPLLLSLTPEDLSILLELPNEGLQSMSNSARISSANTINNLISYLSKPAKPSLQPLLDEFRNKSDSAMKKLLRSLLQVVLDGFLANSSLISKALLGLINHQQVYYMQLKQEVVAAQEPHLRDMLSTLLDSLWTGTNFAWWQLDSSFSYTVIEDNLKGAKTFCENLNKLISASGRITWY